MRHTITGLFAASVVVVTSAACGGTTEAPTGEGEGEGEGEGGEGEGEGEGEAPAGTRQQTLRYDTLSTSDAVERASTAVLTIKADVDSPRPVIVLLPGWGGNGDVGAGANAQTTLFVDAGYAALNVGFHNTASAPGGAAASFYSDMAESVDGALTAACADADLDCNAIVLVGVSYGGTQTHPVARYLRSVGWAGDNGEVVALLSQDAGYTVQDFREPPYAETNLYSVAMIENQGDLTFPIDACDFANCGARERAAFHDARGDDNVLSLCPEGGSHGSRGFAGWDAWVLSATKTMLHDQQGVARFTGFIEADVDVDNACLP